MKKAQVTILTVYTYQVYTVYSNTFPIIITITKQNKSHTILFQVLFYILRFMFT